MIGSDSTRIWRVRKEGLMEMMDSVEWMGVAIFFYGYIVYDC